MAVDGFDLFAMTFATFTAAQAGALAACGLASAGLFALAWRKSSLGGTTLLAPWNWSLVSLLAIATSEVLVGLGGSLSRSEWPVPLRFAAAMTTFCPMMAVLGAKRPQDRGWQFIVLSLWAILSLPSFKWLLFGGVQEIHSARFWFLVALTLVGAANGITTRFWPSSLLVCAGQMALVAPYLPATQCLLPGAQAPLSGLLAIVVAGGLLASGLPRGAPAAKPLDRVWLDFRDAFGAVWALRVAERINASAAMHGWPVVLGWRGFRDRENGGPAEAVPEIAADNLRTLLRRFVSPAWIDARLGERASEDLTASIR